MEHPVIVTFPKGQLGPKDKERLTKHGILWLEAESDHKAIQQVAITQPLVQTVMNGDAVVVAALAAISAGNDTTTMRAFIRELASAVKPAN